jgi:hypothetical protein
MEVSPKSVVDIESVCVTPSVLEGESGTFPQRIALKWETTCKH